MKQFALRARGPSRRPTPTDALTHLVDAGETFIVERHGEPVAVVVPFDEYEDMKRRLEALSR